MHTMNSCSQIAAFATIKSLSDEKKYRSPYQLLGEFIRNIISDKAIYSFQTTEMKNMLFDTFGFDIPEAVIKTSVRNMAGISLSNNVYSVSIADLCTDSLFEEKKKEANEISAETISLLIKYIEERSGEHSVSTNVVAKELISILIGEASSNSGKYIDIISEFILKNENNEDIQEYLNKVKEGSILYIGLNHNIGETGSITKPLVLYLGTEILFSLAGYNGTIYKQFADDFFSQVRAANSNGTKKITLKYFSDIKEEINDFFLTASDIVDGKKEQYNEKPAMSAIINGCSTSSDVDVKQSDFYHNLQYAFGITEDTSHSFYDEEFFESNLESFDDIDDSDNKKESGIKYISHINKLRNGKVFSNDIDSEYLLVTNTKLTLLLSKEQTDIKKEKHGVEHIANFAVSLDRITSLLWYKLGNGFGSKEYPSSLNAVLGARVVLSASIAKNASRAYFDIKKQYESGIISKEQLAARIITLKNKSKLPEELHGDDIAEIMDFSPEFLSRYEEEHKNNQRALDEKEKALAELKTDVNNKEKTIASQAAIISEKDQFLAEREETIAFQDSRIKEQDKELAEYRKRDAEKAEKKKRRKNILLFIWNIIWKAFLVIAVVLISVHICKKISPHSTTVVGIIIGVLGLIPTVISVIKKDFKKHFSKKSNNEEM